MTDNSVDPEIAPPVRTVAGFVSAVTKAHQLLNAPVPELGQRIFWYRGHSDESWPLEPSLLRSPYASRAREYDAKFQTEFSARGASLLGRDLPDCSVRRYAFMQHHGLPTRLLDWTESSLIALYFALRGRSSGDSAVWVLDPLAVSGIGPFQNKALPPFGPEYEMDGVRAIVDWRDGQVDIGRRLEEFVPIPIVPSHVGLRETSQRGPFTLHGYAPGVLDELSLELAFGSARIRTLLKLRIPVDCRASMRTELFHLGISETSIYPDLDGLARELRFLASNGRDDPFK